MAVRILITNDDSVSAAQLLPLIRYCRKFGEVTAVVPRVEQSGKSHGIEIHKPFHAQQVELAEDVSVWVVDSTPADCVRFAMLGLGLSFNLVISGVNRGLNIGTDILYSGTVSAACEAVCLGTRALALSTPPENYDNALAHLDQVFAYLHEKQLYRLNNIFNVNIPADPKGIRITRQGGPYYSDDFLPMGDGLYRPQGKPVWIDREDDTLDTDATLHGYISITPLTVDRTNYQVYRQLSQL